MRFRRLNILLILVIFVSSCDIRLSDIPNSGIPTSTPFQPQTENASDSLYSAAAPTPIYLPTLTSLPSTPMGVVSQPGSLPDDLSLPTVTALANLNPLTGLPPSDPLLLERRPLAIKVANYPRYIRPQSGLTLADNIYEYYIEAALTRFIAVFYGNNSEWVGPVRSGRYFDEHIQRMYHAYLVFKFADPRVESHLATTSDVAPFLVVPSIGSCPPFHLKPDRDIEVYNNSYFNTLLWEDCVNQNGLENQRQDIRNGFFSETVPSSELRGTKIFTYYSADSYHYWLYNRETKQYIRYQELSGIRDGKEEAYDVLIDSVSGETVHAANIVFLLAHHNFSNTF